MIESEDIIISASRVRAQKMDPPPDNGDTQDPVFVLRSLLQNANSGAMPILAPFLARLTPPTLLNLVQLPEFSRLRSLLAQDGIFERVFSARRERMNLVSAMELDAINVLERIHPRTPVAYWRLWQCAYFVSEMNLGRYAGERGGNRPLLLEFYGRDSINNKQRLQVEFQIDGSVFTAFDDDDEHAGLLDMLLIYVRTQGDHSSFRGMGPFGAANLLLPILEGVIDSIVQSKADYRFARIDRVTPEAPKTTIRLGGARAVGLFVAKRETVGIVNDNRRWGLSFNNALNPTHAIEYARLEPVNAWYRDWIIRPNLKLMDAPSPAGLGSTLELSRVYHRHLIMLILYELMTMYPDATFV